MAYYMVYDGMVHMVYIKSVFCKNKIHLLKEIINTKKMFMNRGLR